MKKIMLLTAVVFFSTQASAANWILIFENKLGNKFYVDAESIHMTPEKTTLVWEKITSPDNTAKTLTLEELKEVDCSRRRYKVLQGYVSGGEKGLESVKKTDWEYFDPSDLSSTLFNVVCEGSNKRQNVK